MGKFFNRPAQQKTDDQYDAQLLDAAFDWSDNRGVGDMPPAATLYGALEKDADPNAVNGDGETALLTICRKKGAAALAKALIGAGALTNVTAKDGDTPLLRSAAAGDVETMRVLIAHDADIHAIKKEPPRGRFGDAGVGGGERDIYHMIVVHNINEGPELLAARAEALKLVLEQKDAPPCSEISFIYVAKPHFRHLFPGMAEAKELDAAAGEGNVSRVKELLAQGVHPDIATTFGADQALFTAASKGNIALMDILLAAGADINLLSPANNLTPLQRAAWAGQPEAFDHLLDKGADPDHLGLGTGDSILSVAKSGGMEEHAISSMARRSVTAQAPITVKRPLRLKAGSPA